MPKTTKRQIVITSEADEAMREVAQRQRRRISDIYRDAVAVYLVAEGFQVDMTVEVGSPLLQRQPARPGD
jgi:hypothetical protein